MEEGHDVGDRRRDALVVRDDGGDEAGGPHLRVEGRERVRQIRRGLARLLRQAAMLWTGNCKDPLSEAVWATKPTEYVLE